MKKCPFCAEEIQDAAIKCKHCREFLSPLSPPGPLPAGLPWYFRKSFIIIALLSVGPLALPLIWWQPQLSRPAKIGLTIVILLISWLLYRSTLESLRVLKEYYRLLESS